MSDNWITHPAVIREIYHHPIHGEGLLLSVAWRGRVIVGHTLLTAAGERFIEADSLEEREWSGRSDPNKEKPDV